MDLMSMDRIDVSVLALCSVTKNILSLLPEPYFPAIDTSGTSPTNPDLIFDVADSFSTGRRPSLFLISPME